MDKLLTDEERIYPCAECGKLRSENEGGTVFSFCDECWDKKYKSPRVQSYYASLDVERLREEISELCLNYLTLCKQRDDYTPAIVEPELTFQILSLLTPYIQAQQEQELACQIEFEAMKAENANRERRGESPAYNDQAFLDLIKRYKLNTQEAKNGS